MARIKRRKKTKLLKPLMFGGAAFLVAWLLMGKKGKGTGLDVLTYNQRSQEFLPPVYSGNIAVPPGTKPGTIVGQNEFGRRIIYDPEKEKVDREILQKQKG